MKNNYLTLIGIIIGIGLWFFISLIFKSLILPSPFTVLLRLKELFSQRTFFLDIVSSLIRVTLGFLLGSGLGIIFGFILAASPPLSSLFDLWIQILRPVSPFAYLPLFILILGLGTYPVIFIIFLGTFLPMTIIIIDALKNINRDYLDTARTFGATGLKKAVYVEFPLILPIFFSSLRVFTGVGWILVIGAEMLSTNSGLGFRLMSARYLLDFPELYATIIVIGIIGYLFDALLKNLIKIYES